MAGAGAMMSARRSTRRMKTRKARVYTSGRVVAWVGLGSIDSVSTGFGILVSILLQSSGPKNPCWTELAVTSSFRFRSV